MKKSNFLTQSSPKNINDTFKERDSQAARIPFCTQADQSTFWRAPALLVIFVVREEQNMFLGKLLPICLFNGPGSTNTFKIYSFSHPLWKHLQNISLPTRKSKIAGTLGEGSPSSTCHMSDVTCHMLCVQYNYYIFHFFLLLILKQFYWNEGLLSTGHITHF